MDALLQPLNDRQKGVVTYRGEAPLLVIAAAGTGKTQSLTSRVASFIVEGVDPTRILALTFTNKAAREMRDRAERLSHTPADRMSIGTYHSVCARLLRTHADKLPQIGLAGLTAGFHILDNNASVRLVKDCLYRTGYRENSHVRAPDVYAILNAWRNAGIDMEEAAAASAASTSAPAPPGCTPSRLAVDAARTLYRVFRQACIQRNAIDFGDLIMYTLRLLRSCADVRAACQSRWTHVFVDEFQDTNDSQLQLLKLLYVPAKTRLMVVGDDCQAIHGWRGAVIGNILQFERHFPGAQVMLLEDNYRSVSTILDAANRLIACNAHQRKKVLRATRPTADGAGAPIQLESHETPESEAAAVAAHISSAMQSGVDPGQFAILYRINAQSQPLEEALRAAGVPYCLRGAMSFYQRAEVKDVLAYLRILYAPHDCDADFKRVANTPPRGIGPKLLQDVLERAAKRNESCLAAAQTFVTAVEDQVARKKKAAEAGGAGSTGGRRFAGMRALLEVLGELRPQAQAPVGDGGRLTLAATAEALLERTGYLRWIGEQQDGADKVLNVQQLIATFEGLEYDDLLNRVFDDEDEPIADGSSGMKRVSLMTLHASKGLEFPRVFIVGFDSAMLPFHKSVQEGRLEEERRLAYVGVMRARDELHLSYPRRRAAYGGAVQTDGSMFLRELGL
ncbi:hypothetical protein HYH03_003652 [Edaphochlamys debaryana]|uniref:DNA 3'-5' helicase n=1 Tax=Edaphochlamys debaryana TaxID=47281 RepID=A0A835Y992_9CHLO|nr:hypothetical protein HYH03_003652 [Edaphochlamys debaryana]|eukprot:KAG2498393.1 hypothetical protein HYH03_003652 [Edaphochlamys debaryana]